MRKGTKVIVELKQGQFVGKVNKKRKDIIWVQVGNTEYKFYQGAQEIRRAYPARKRNK